jgi:hypothetical protein
MNSYEKIYELAAGNWGYSSVLGEDLRVGVARSRLSPSCLSHAKSAKFAKSPVIFAAFANFA